MTKTVYQIFGVQMDVAFADVASNTKQVLESARKTVDAGADLTVFPECVLSGYCFSDRESALQCALESDARELQTLVEFCRDVKSAIVVGYLEREGNQLFNAASLIGADGLIGTYRKVHLPHLGVDRFTTPGPDGFQVFDVNGLRVGLLICYDSAFPEASRVESLLGADLIALPTNWPSTSGSSADVLPSCRALENHVYFIAVNRVGKENGFRFIGKSRISGPNGRDLAFAPRETPEIIQAQIEPGLARNKHLINVPGEHEIDRFRDRHPEHYGLIASKQPEGSGKSS